jgi:hypothetical protein
MVNFTNCTFASMYEGTFLELKWSQVLHDFDPQNKNARIKFSDNGETLVAIGSNNMSVVVLSAQNGLALASVKVPNIASVFFNNHTNIYVTPKNAKRPLGIFLQAAVTTSNNVTATLLLKLSLN